MLQKNTTLSYTCIPEKRSAMALKTSFTTYSKSMKSYTHSVILAEKNALGQILTRAQQ